MSFDKTGQYADVLKEVEAGKNSFITIDPLAKPIELYSGLAYKETSNPERALKEFNIARQYNPNSFLVYNNIGITYTDKKEYDKAIENFMKALSLAPKNEITLKNLSINYFGLKKYKECMETLDKVNWQSDEYLKSLYNEAKRLLNTPPQTTPIQVK
jgi:tetratricopeptide (TPR) repeat protein